jgi:hypothetical protein
MGILLGATAGVVGEGVGSALTLKEAELGEAAAQGALYGAALGADAERGRGGEGLWQEVTVGQLRQELAAASPSKR